MTNKPGNNDLLRTSKFDHGRRIQILMARLAGRGMWRRSGAGWAWILVVVCAPASAHGFGMRYDLPLPLLLWIIGAASTVLLSFLFVAIVVRWNPETEAPAEVNLLQWKMGRLVSGQAFRFIARLFAVGALIVIVVAGMIGDQTPTRNLAPTAIWIAWWVGFSYLSAFIGDVWCVINPWAALFEWYEKSFPIQSAWRRARIRWPKTLGVSDRVHSCDMRTRSPWRSASSRGSRRPHCASKHVFVPRARRK
jgi:hypothetical protein